MTKEKTPGGTRFQFLLFGLLLLILIIWANRKCTRSQNEFAQERRAEELLQHRLDSLKAVPAPTNPENNTVPSVQRDTIQGGQMQIIREKTTPLYVTINNLAMRKGPGLKYEIIDRLPLYAEVNFLNEVSDSIYTIKLGSISPSEPWVKIRNLKGREGWVFGAGVDFYKYKLEGVE
jgi:hypothetical protein